MSGFIIILMALLAAICFLASGLSAAMQSRSALKKEIQGLRAVIRKLQEETP
jgi:hypothetical protein